MIRKQLAFLLARQQIYWDLDGDKVEDELREIMNNSRLVNTLKMNQLKKKQNQKLKKKIKKTKKVKKKKLV